MSEDCRNDCAAPLRFPRRLFNRPGLSRIDYRIGAYADIREFLLRNLDRDATLGEWTHRGADDPGIALLEGASILGDILTFYQELYANEAYLRTARWRESIADLARLVGYRLSPGLGGGATFAFEIKGDRAVTVPAGFPLKAQVEGLDKPADFETSEELTAYPWLSRFNLFRPLVWPEVKAATATAPSTNEFYIETPDQLTAPVELKQGDRLLVGDAVANAPGRIDNSEIVIVDSTRVLHSTTLIKIKGALKRTPNAPGLVAYKIGRTFRHFGHNGPQKKIIPPARVASTSTTLASTIQPPPVRVQPESVTTQPPPVTGHPPPMTEQPPPVTVPLLGATNILPSLQVESPAIPATISISGNPAPPLWRPSQGSLTVLPPPLPVQPPPVTTEPPLVTVYPQAVMAQPPLLPIPPTLMTTTTDVPQPTEASINFFRWLNRPANPFESIWSIIEPNLDTKEFPLDAEVQDLPAGVPLVAQFTAYINSSRTQKEERTLVRTIASVEPTYMTWGLLTSNTTLITLKNTLETPPLTPYLYTDIREFQFHETLSPQLTLKAAPEEDTSAAKGHDLFFYGTDAQARDLLGRAVQFEHPGGVTTTTTVTAVAPETTPAFAARKRLRALTVSHEVTYSEFPNENPSVNVYGNLVTATQGKTERETPLGNGDARQVFQAFKLPKAPLTYLISPGETPPEVPELEVWVSQRLWGRVASLFGRGPLEQIYVVREDANNDSWVQFGDGKTGARLPSGVKNVVAKFRTGTGAHGPLKPETKVQAGARLDRLDKIQMPSTSAGGSEPESGENAREAAPGKIQSLDRLVSIKDFESETLALSGVERASAAWRTSQNIPAVHVTVLMATGRAAEIEAVRQVLADYNLCRGPRRFPVVVNEGRLLYVAVDLLYGLDPTFREDVVAPVIKAALGVEGAGGDFRRGLFGTLNRRFGEREYATRIEGTVQNVEGVVWAKVKAFVELGEAFNPAGKPIDPATIPLPTTLQLKPAVKPDHLHMLALHSAHLAAVAAAEPPK